MKLNFSAARMSDLDAIMRIEHAGFTPQEAASRISMAARITNYPDTFIVARVANTIVGYVVGLFTDSQPNQPAAPYLAILSLAVAPNMQHHGIGRQLLAKLTQVAQLQKRTALTLTCLSRLIPFYEHVGFHNDGLAASTHAGEVWFNMSKPVKPVAKI